MWITLFCYWSYFANFFSTRQRRFYAVVNECPSCGMLLHPEIMWISHMKSIMWNTFIYYWSLLLKIPHFLQFLRAFCVAFAGWIWVLLTRHFNKLISSMFVFPNYCLPELNIFDALQFRIRKTNFVVPIWPLQPGIEVASLSLIGGQCVRTTHAFAGEKLEWTQLLLILRLRLLGLIETSILLEYDKDNSEEVDFSACADEIESKIEEVNNLNWDV